MDISIEEQADILDIQTNYIWGGGNFWIALNEDGKVIGTIGSQKATGEIAILKKLFVYSDYRGKEFGVGIGLYNTLIFFTKEQGFSTLILDTPAKAERSHGFYKKVGFKEIIKQELKIAYDYPDCDSMLFELELNN